MRNAFNLLFLFFTAAILMAQTNPGARYGHTMVNYGRNIYLFGGTSAALGKSYNSRSNEIEINDLWVYKDSDKVWEEMHTLAPPPVRRGHSANVWNGKMYIYGGETKNTIYNDLWSYDFLTNTWTHVPVGGHCPALSEHASAINGSIVLFSGGRNSDDSSCDSNFVLDLSQPQNGFTEKPNLPEPLQHGGAYYYNSAWYFVGGIWHDYDSATPGYQPSYSSYIYQLDPTSSNWTAVNTSGYVSEASKFAGLYIPGRNEYYLIGGEKYNYSTNQPEPMNSIISIALGTNNWTETLHDPDLVAANEIAAAYLPKDSGSVNNTWLNKASFSEAGFIYFYGGIKIDGSISSGFYKYDPASRSVTKLNSLNAPGNVTATLVSSSQIDLSWADNSSNEAGFRIEKKTGAGAFTLVYTTSQDVITYSDTDNSEGTSYTYRIAAIGSSGEYSDYSAEVVAVTPLLTPANLTSGILPNGSIVLNWSDVSLNETGYLVERKTENGTYAQITSVGQNISTYTDASASTGIKYYYRVKAYNDVASSSYSNETSVTPVGVENNNSLPSQYRLYQNYPNPFNPSTIIKYALTETSHVKLAVYDLLGREICSLVDEIKSAGYHQAEFDAGLNKLTGGIYFYKIQTEKFVNVKKMILLK